MDLHDFSDVAENYDLYIQVLFGGRDDGVADFHLDLARQYGQKGVLDIACGTGATLLPLVEAGFRVTGVDISHAMLNVLARKLALLPNAVQGRAKLVRADMVKLDLMACYSLAIIPRSGFMHLLTPEDQERALRGIHEVLEPGGVFSFNTFDPNYELIAKNLKGKSPPLQFRGQFTNRSGRQEWIWNRTEYDPVEQRIEAEWIFEEMGPDGTVMMKRAYPLKMRWSFEPEIRHLLKICGFEVLEIYSNYQKAPRKYGGNLIWVVRRI
jgi:ubiquinone/menaquinone biosynthesis C-methylase UbiE